MIADRFKEFSLPNRFSRVDNQHILELYIGLDEKLRKSIELRARFNYRKVYSAGAIEVNQYKNDQYNTIRFSLDNDDVSGLFYTFCEDLIEQTRNLKNKDEGYQSIINRYYQWKKLFNAKKSDYLTENEIMGLIGEILFLRGPLAEKVGISNALKSWSGQELTHKDFSCENEWYEVKTISSGKTEVKISSLEQLESDKPGELVVFSVEKMSVAYDGIKLNSLIIDTANMFDLQDDRDLFFTQVALQGYMYDDYYDEFVYELSSMNRYLVDEKFPVLTHSQVPNEIVKVSYTLDLAQISKFIIK